jgi:hypothetical protein
MLVRGQMARNLRRVLLLLKFLVLLLLLLEGSTMSDNSEDIMSVVEAVLVPADVFVAAVHKMTAEYRRMYPDAQAHECWSEIEALINSTRPVTNLSHTDGVYEWFEPTSDEEGEVR